MHQQPQNTKAEQAHHVTYKIHMPTGDSQLLNKKKILFSYNALIVYYCIYWLRVLAASLCPVILSHLILLQCIFRVKCQLYILAFLHLYLSWKNKLNNKHRQINASMCARAHTHTNTYIQNLTWCFDITVFILAYVFTNYISSWVCFLLISL